MGLPRSWGVFAEQVIQRRSNVIQWLFKPSSCLCAATTAVHRAIGLLAPAHDEEVFGAAIALVALIAFGRTIGPLEYASVRTTGRALKIPLASRRYSHPFMLAVGADGFTGRVRIAGALELQNLDGHSITI
ncbi:hypothetical protein [Pseudomonas lundensis]|uniref:hypothetical protein n=1 Tax=Pseudomonas lundensis TaxID=86185 RepID=UPI00385EAF77